MVPYRRDHDGATCIAAIEVRDHARRLAIVECMLDMSTQDVVGRTGGFEHRRGPYAETGDDPTKFVHMMRHRIWPGI